MKTKLLLPLLGLWLSAQLAGAQGTAFTYQGWLNEGLTPATGLYDFTFKLFDDAESGMPDMQVGTTKITNGLPVTNGVVTVTLDFGGIFTGQRLWLEITATPNGLTTLDPFTPRTELTPTPYAIFAESVASGGLPANVARLDNATQTFTGNNTFGNIIATGLDVAGTVRATSFSGLGTLPWQVVSLTAQQAQPNTGYLLVSPLPGQVTLTLPTSPNVGDVVRVSARRDWKLAQNSGQSVIAKNLAGNVDVTWTPRLGNPCSAIACSADGTKLVAVQFSSEGPAPVATSADCGCTWTYASLSFVFAVGSAVASSADGCKLVVAVPGNRLYTSTDFGRIWTARENVRNWKSVASSADGSKLVAVVAGGFIYRSTDSGVTWIEDGSLTSQSWASVASSADGNRLVAAINGGRFYTSADSGTTWTQRDTSDRNWVSVASSANGALLVAAVDNGQIYTSMNSGVAWFPQASGTRAWKAVASSADGSKLVAVVNGGRIYTSTDSGVTWTERDSSNRNWTSVASSADGTKLAASAFTGAGVYTSGDNNHPSTTVGVSGYLVGSAYSAIELQYVGNGTFIPLSHEGVLIAY